jgi:hypothetical protein
MQACGRNQLEPEPVGMWVGEGADLSIVVL